MKLPAWLKKLTPTTSAAPLLDKAAELAEKYFQHPSERQAFIKDAYKAEVDDRNAARANGRDKSAPEILSYLTILGAGALGWAVFADFINWSSLTGTQQNLITTFFGWSIARVNDVYGYWFGSSMGSRLKDKINR